MVAAKKTTRNQERPRSKPPSPWLGWCLLTWAAAAIWVSLVPEGRTSWRAEKRSAEAIATGKEQVEAYKLRFGEIPISLNGLRAHSRMSEGGHFPTYDSMGQRIQFQRLSERDFLLRSFGLDGFPDNLVHQDDIVASNIEQALTSDWTIARGSSSGAYPSPALLGMASPNGKRVARVFWDRESRKQHLVVSDLDTRATMVARSPWVEEFLWVHNSEAIVFTTRGDRDRPAGLFFWNLRADRVQNILHPASFREGLWGSVNPAEPQWISLSLDKSRRVLVHTAVQTEDALDPSSFYSRRLRVSIDRSSRSPVLETVATSPSATFNTAAASATTAESMNPLQRQWVQLPYEGEMGEILESWQSFCDAAIDTPLFSYGLWHLAVLYGQAAEQSKDSEQEANVLAAYGIEISQALMEMEQAPTYLRAMAHHHLRNLTRRPLRLDYGIELDLHQSKDAEPEFIDAAQ